MKNTKQDKIQSNLDLTDTTQFVRQKFVKIRFDVLSKLNTVIHKQHEILKNNKRDLYWKKKKPISAAAVVSSLTAHHVCPNVNE